MWQFVFLNLLIIIANVISKDELLPLVNIKQGLVQGSVAPDGDYYQFYGIPYADDTSGRNRFKAPSPAPLFTETFVANRKDIKCVHPLGIGYEGTEDCLVANVFTPSLENQNLLPVMVWIKGKEFESIPEPSLSFRNLVEKDVVVVSLNFRESILGFLCLGTENAPGNVGLKDIVLGLKWIRENIKHFGGNPESITLFGHGTGGAAVDLVTLSPLTEGLVHRAIAQSGNSVAPWAVTRNPLKNAVLVAEALGHEVTDLETLSELFTTTSVVDLMAVINNLELKHNFIAFSPCIENENLEGVEPFLIKSPYEMIVKGDFKQIPFITGFVENEGTIRAEKAIQGDWLNKMETSFIEFIQPDLQFETDDEHQAIAEDIRSYYFSDGPVDMDSIHEYLAYHGDTMILVSSIRNARLRARKSTAPVYLYQFSYEGQLGEPFVGPLSVVGAAHGEELAYIFNSGLTTHLDSSDTLMLNILLERWTNFAKTGEPTSETSDVLWIPVSAQHLSYLNIVNDEPMKNGRSTLEHILINPHSNIMSFWEHIYSKHFKDASWDPNARIEYDEDNLDDEHEGESEGGVENEVDVVGSGDGVDVEGSGEEIDVEGSGDEIDVDGSGGEDSGEDTIDPDESEEDSDDSASTAVAYTFLIITLYSILNYFHLSQIQSF